MKAKKIKLFDNQPELEDSHIEDLTGRGLLVPAKSPRNRATCADEITNPTAGDVVSYRPLDKLLQAGQITQDDARRMLAIETTRINGRPRRSHIVRLMVVAFAKDKQRVLGKIEEILTKSWRAKNLK